MNKHPNKQIPKSARFQKPALLTSEIPEELEEWARAVRALNDAFRLSFTNTELYTSPQILDLDMDTQSEVLERVRNYRTFDEASDPDMTHSIGVFEHKDLTFIWEIFCLTPDGKNLSENPLDLNLTRRHMMILQENEWWSDLPKKDS